MPKARKFSGVNSLKNLHVFCVAARLGSFKEAASELFITASAVSHQIRTLEERLGFELFERRTRSVTLTARGSDLLDSVGPLLDRIDEEVSALVGARQSVPLRVILPPFFAAEVFIPRLAEFTNRYPNIDIYLEITDAKPSRETESADVAVLLSDAPPADMRSQILFPLELVPACAPSYLPDNEQLCEVDYGAATLIVHRQRRETWKRWFREEGVDVRQTPNIFELDSMTAVVQSAEQGIGVALVPAVLAKSRFESGKLTRLPGNSYMTGQHFYMTWHKNSPRKKEVAALAEWIGETT